MGGLSSKLEALGFVCLVLGSVRSPGSGPPGGNSGEVKLVDLCEGEATGLGDEEEDVSREECDCLEKKNETKSRLSAKVSQRILQETQRTPAQRNVIFVCNPP